MRVLGLSLLATLAVALVPSAASAATVSCPPGKYLVTTADAVASLKATGLPRKTDGYAPRCLVAEAVAAEATRTATFPKSIMVYGARWNGGKWRCTKAGTSVTCRKTGATSRKVTMRLRS